MRHIPKILCLATMMLFLLPVVHIQRNRSSPSLHS